ncbi:MAG TPA: hypothetical protein VMT85_18330 [Thermoanaerobaculia bacterium]|nr:hypothetical protein [Thermoanaerobaculia bacterium]
MRYPLSRRPLSSCARSRPACESGASKSRGGWWRERRAARTLPAICCWWSSEEIDRRATRGQGGCRRGPPGSGHERDDRDELGDPDELDDGASEGDTAERDNAAAVAEQPFGAGWDPPRLLHLRVDAWGGRLQVLDPRLPVEEDEVVSLFDASGAEGTPRAGLRLGETIRLVPLLSEDRGPWWSLGEPALRFEAGLEAGALPPGSGWIGLWEPGRLELIDLDAHGRVRARGEVALPFEVSRRGRSLTLESPPIRALPGNPPRIVIGPQAVGALRLRTLLIEPGQVAPALDEPDPDRAEKWSALPGPESIGDSEVLEVDDARGRHVYLVVSTLRSDKLGMLERKKLRLYELVSDRTRAGAPPIAEIRTASRLWQELHWSLVDATGDDRLDLVLLQPEGLGGGKLAVDLYAGLEGGGFEPKFIRSVIGHTPELWRYGRDLTGDGVPDLLLASDGGFEVWAGRSRPDKRGLLEDTSSQEWSSSGRIEGELEGERVRRTVAIDGELVLFIRRARGRSLLELVHVDGSL